MRPFLLAALAALALAGCQKSTETAITRTTANGVDTLYSKRTVVDGVARFECMASRSGQCHYLLLDPACRPDAACAKAPIRSFALAVGTTQSSGTCRRASPSASARIGKNNATVSDHGGIVGPPLP